MEERIYHGSIIPSDIARNLISHFNRGNLRVRKLGKGSNITVQIATTARPASGGQTAISVNIQKVEDGVSIRVGNQAWLGVAASFGITALTALRNPLHLISRLDDLAQDIENIQLSDEVWKVIENTARSLNIGFELSERLRRIACDYCNTANPVGEARCIACGAPLGDVQPVTCQNCGFVLTQTENKCPNCREYIRLFDSKQKETPNKYQ